jgi:predicted nuclease of restriction endonuclease-like (RecB) superfamily
MELNKAGSYILEIKQILANARQKAYAAVNTAMVEAYWLIGRRIVEEEQQGANRAAYGKEIVKKLSQELSNEFGRGFSERSLREFRQFYQNIPDLFEINSIATSETSPENKWRTPFAISVNPIWRTAFAKLHWSHYQRVLRVSDEKARMYYLTEAAEQNWSISTLDRNISTLYYQRLISSQKKEIVEQEMHNKNAALTQSADDFIRNPAVLDFLKLPTGKSYTEKELEQALIDNLQQFLLELGKGFSFVARQKHIRTESSDFYIDLVFYNYILKCFVIVELKTHKINHQDIGQLDMYVRMFDDLERTEGDNPTIGILLCTETDKTIAKYSVLNENQQLFANKYLPYLPSEEELATEIEREKLIIKQQLGYEL